MQNSQTQEEMMTTLNYVILKGHIFGAQDKEICDQCVRPWHDGICKCGHIDDEKIQMIRNIAFELIKNGNDLNQL